MEEQSTQVVARATASKPAWMLVWEKPDYSVDVQYGVEQLIEKDGTKYYRAYVTSSPGERVRKTSPTFKACDEADPAFNAENQFYLSSAARDTIVREAALIRGGMATDERSPRDMAQIAESLHVEAVEVYHDWQHEQEEMAVKRLADLENMRVFRAWLRGLQLLMEQGEPEEQSLLQKLFPPKK